MSLFSCQGATTKSIACFLNNSQVQLEILDYLAAGIALLISLTVVRYFLRKSEEKKHLNELNFELRRNFHNIYGEFRSNVRLWKNAGKPKNPAGHEALYTSAVQVEGKLEALLSDIAGQKTLSVDETCILGLYRQAFQTLREALRGDKNRDVPCTYDHNDYHLFNELTAAISRLLVTGKPQPSELEARQNLDAILDIRSSDWPLAHTKYGKSQMWKPALKAVISKRQSELESSPNNESR